MPNLRLALDWTPNVNHIGFLLAKELGFYHEQGLELDILNPLDDNYALTPGKKLELGVADLAIAPFETVISLNNKANPVEAVALFAILQNDLSSIVTLKSSGLSSPRLLDRKIYASYKARYEDHIVREMIKNAGGKGDINILYPEKLGIWNTLLSGNADATWIFNNWEGIEASGNLVELYSFTLSDFNIPYGYSPVVLAKKESIQNQKALYAGFMRASRKGFLYTQAHPSEAKTILSRYVTDSDLNNIDLDKALAYSNPHFGNASTCGVMEKERVEGFLNWLVEKGLENPAILKQDLFTNELIG
jgi:ABC-type nitrate/sulfonate/bicarbonate transport system substrate-binding protein